MGKNKSMYRWILKVIISFKWKRIGRVKFEIKYLTAIKLNKCIEIRLRTKQIKTTSLNSKDSSIK